MCILIGLCALAVLFVVYQILYSREFSRLCDKYLEMLEHDRLPFFVRGGLWPKLYDNTDNSYWIGEGMKPVFYASGGKSIIYYRMSWKGLEEIS